MPPKKNSPVKRPKTRKRVEGAAPPRAKTVRSFCGISIGRLKAWQLGLGVIVALLAVIRGCLYCVDRWFLDSKPPTPPSTQTQQANQPPQPTPMLVQVAATPKDRIDLNYLNEKYPTAFMVFRGNTPQKGIKDLKRTDVQFDCECRVEWDYKGVLDVNAYLKEFIIPGYRTTGNVISQRLRPEVGRSYQLFWLPIQKSWKEMVYFELLERDPKEPVYVIGVKPVFTTHQIGRNLTN